jgi:hypothetical protein
MASDCHSTTMYVFSPNIEHPSQPSHSCRNDSQANSLNLLTRESLPEPPGLANRRSINGPVVHFRVLAFPLRMNDALKWAEDNQVGVGRKPHMRCELALPTILRRLPPDCCRVAVVPIGSGGATALSVVVAMNKTAEDLARAEDLEMIQNVQRVMGTNNPPAWYTFVR